MKILINRLLIFIAALTLFIGLSGPSVFAADYPVVNVDLMSYFDSANIVPNTEGLSGPYGSTLNFETNLASSAGYTFAYWVVNGTVERNLPVDHDFILTEGIVLVAVFSHDTEHVGLFRDSNLEMLGIEYATVGNSLTVDDSGITIPDKPGYVVADPKWNASLTLTTDTVLTLQYDVVNVATYTVVAVGGTLTGDLSYDSVATAVADTPEVDTYFQYWSVNGEIVSYDSTYSFTVLEDKTLVAVFDDAVATATPLVSMSGELSLRNGYRSFLGKMSIPSGYTLVEFGLLTATTQSVPTFTDGTSTIHKGSSYLGDTMEFVMSLSTTFVTARPYMICDDGTGTLVEIYGLPYDGPYGVFISEYIEGSGNNKAVELYNATSNPVTLTGYELVTYYNGNPMGSTLALDAYTIPAGDVLVIYNSGSVLSISEVGDIASGLTTFNGDDAIALRRNGLVIDQFGIIGNDPGSSWPLPGGSSSDNTLVRAASVTGPSALWNPNEWVVYSQDTLGFLGRHYMLGETDHGARPLISGEVSTQIDEGGTYTPLTGVTASDYEDGDLTSSLTYSVRDSSDSLVATPGDFSGLDAGDYSIIYSVTDSASNTSTRTTTLTIAEVVAGVLYSTGFETSEGFTTSTSYNNTTMIERGPEGSKWGFYYGTVSTTSFITGATSAHMRWYSTAAANLGYVRTMFKVTDPLNVVFNVKNNSANLDVEVSYSYDGITWLGQEVFDVTTSTQEFTYDMSGFTLTGDKGVYIKMQVSFVTAPSTGKSLIIDDVVINSNP